MTSCNLDLATLENQDGWNRSDAVLGCQFHVFANVAFTNDSLTFVFRRELVDDRSQTLTRWAAVWPKVNQDWFIGLAAIFFPMFPSGHINTGQVKLFESSWDCICRRYDVNKDWTLTAKTLDYIAFSCFFWSRGQFSELPTARIQDLPPKQSGNLNVFELHLENSNID